MKTLARICLTVAMLATAVGASATNAWADTAPVYYLALGDSVAAIDHGYPQQLAAALTQQTPTLRLVNLSCPGETTSSMISGYPVTPPPLPQEQHFRLPCQRYPHGSQLEEAAAFLRGHRPFVALVTINIAGDFGECLATLDFSDDCRTRHQAAMTADLATILGELRAAAGPQVPIVGMNYYDPFTGLWVLADALFGGQQDQAEQLAVASVDFVVRGNDALEGTYTAAGDPWADVETAFAVTDFTDTAQLAGVGTVPLSVFNACTLTLFCARLDVHPNDQGSAVIAQAFEAVLPA